MAHEVENMFYMGQTPWHGLGTKVIDAPTSEEAIKLAGLNWRVNLADLRLADGRMVTHKATVRDSDGSILGVVGPDYTPLQNHEAFAFFDPFIRGNLAEYHTAGSLREGRRVWILARMRGVDPMEVISGDAVESYILLSNGHDGSLAVRVGFTDTRVVCANTLRAAHGSAGSKLLRVKHTSGVKDTLDEIREVMDCARNEFVATVEQYRQLARRDIDARTLETYVKVVFRKADKPAPTGLVLASQSGASDAPEESKRLVPRIVDLFESGRGMKGMRPTMWRAFNAVTEYTSHHRGRTQDSRVDSLWFGDSANVNRRALELGLQMAA